MVLKSFIEFDIEKSKSYLGLQFTLAKEDPENI